MSRAEIEEAMRYHHPEKMLSGLPTQPEVTDEMLAPLFRIDSGTYKKIKAGFEERAHRCARELLSEERFAGVVDRLPFSPGASVAGVGDSITDDSLSWFEILRHLLAERRPNDGIELVNAGISGDTTSGVLSRIQDVLEGEPDWVVFLIGTNDIAFVREPPTKSLVSLEEIGRNLRALRDLVKAQGGARLVWMTPPPAIEERIFGDPALTPQQPVWRKKDISEAARLVRETAGEAPLVDLWDAFGDPANPDFLLPDGLHPSLEGQKATAAALVERLAGQTQP